MIDRDPIRFIAVYGEGLDRPFTELILGHGRNQHGLDHANLVRKYKKEGAALYAGHMSIAGEDVLFQGGSFTLGMGNDKERNSRLREEIAPLKQKIMDLHPALHSGEERDVILSR